ncbi:MAG: hypothetical protein AAF696_19030 [Bacteroidota bacterium]
MQKHSPTLLFSLLFISLLLFACEEEIEPDSGIPDVHLSGIVVDKTNQNPLSNWELIVRLGFRFQESIFTDENGKYELVIDDYKQHVIDQGVNPADVEDLFNDGRQIEIRVSSGTPHCQYYIIDKFSPMNEFRSLKSFPFTQVWNFSLNQSGPLQIQLEDSSAVNRSNQFAIAVELRNLETERPYLVSSYTGTAEVFSSVSLQPICLPLDIPVELSYRAYEYVEGMFENPIYERSFTDTLTLTTNGLPTFKIQY